MGINWSIFWLILGTFVVSCKGRSRPGQFPLGSKGFASLTFTDTSYDWGNIHEGQVVQYPFKFRNTGSQPLVFTNALPSCGCTVTDFPRAPIAPGDSGVIRVRFNSSGKTGKQNKTIFLLSNARKPQQVLRIICFVLKPNK